MLNEHGEQLCRKICVSLVEGLIVLSRQDKRVRRLITTVDLVDLTDPLRMSEEHLVLTDENLEFGKDMLQQGIEIGRDHTVHNGVTELGQLIGHSASFRQGVEAVGKFPGDLGLQRPLRPTRLALEIAATGLEGGVLPPSLM